jgi:hypothetical protein
MSAMNALEKRPTPEITTIADAVLETTKPASRDTARLQAWRDRLPTSWHSRSDIGTAGLPPGNVA